MGNRQNKSSSRNPKRDAEKPAGETKDRRDPAEIRAEEFRIAGQRETVEAFVVAFILALLFRAFLAEAFVIPTGSMAPTLMGAHKDLVCDRCSTSFQCGASRERSGPDTNLVVVAGVCPNCRYVNSLDLANESNDATFNGDRILVSKFTYTLTDPERWDVIVFKYPGNPKQNYIKRLVGLPNETLTLRHGDVYARPTGSNQPNVILRKPPEKLLAMSQPVYNTDHQSQTLIDANYPSRWQPWTEGAADPPEDEWQIERSADGLTASLESAADAGFQWLRYYHRWPDDEQWRSADAGESLADVDPYSSRLITDFYAYDSYVHVPAGYVYDSPPSMRSGSRFERLLNGGYSKGDLSPKYQTGAGPEQFGGAAEWGGQDNGHQQLGRDGMHWVGDLIFEADVETSSETAELMLELVEAGVKYRCRIDLATGKATLSIDDIAPRDFDVGEGGQATGPPTAQTSVRAGGRNRLRFSNCDDQLLLWVDDDVIEFDRPTTFDARLFRSDAENHPQYLAAHPLDAAPVAIASRGGKTTIRSLQVDRDKYYIATDNSNFGIFDYDMNKLWRLAGGHGVTHKEIQQVFAMPDKWAEFIGWETRRTVSFELQEDQFFPMGDNSPESLDARCWAGTKARIPLPRGVNRDAWTWSDQSYVPRDLLVGKALVVFWPHSWNCARTVHAKSETNETDPLDGQGVAGMESPTTDTQLRVDEDHHDGPVLEAVGLQKTYGRRRVVDGVNLQVGASEIVGLLGPNGAGKSTSFRMICGMIEPDRGRVYLGGRDVTNWPMFRRARDGHMGYLPQEPSVFKKLTVEQNISSLLELLGMDRAARKVRTAGIVGRIQHHAHSQESGRRVSAAANAVAWRSRVAWSRIRKSSCSMNRSPGSTRSPCNRSKASSCNCATTGSAS